MSILAKLYYWANFSHISVVYNNQGSFLPKAIWPSCVICCPAAWFHVFSLTPWLSKQPLCGTSPVLWQRENILWSTCQFFELPFRNGTYHFLSNFSPKQTTTVPVTTENILFHVVLTIVKWFSFGSLYKVIRKF